MAFSVKPKLSFHWLLESAAQNLRAALEKWWQGSISQEVLMASSKRKSYGHPLCRMQRSMRQGAASMGESFIGSSSLCQLGSSYGAARHWRSRLQFGSSRRSWGFHPTHRMHHATVSARLIASLPLSTIAKMCHTSQPAGEPETPGLSARPSLAAFC